jgi:mRNA interferase RelE/StbE
VKTAYRKKFLKDLAVIPSQTRRRIEVFAFEEALQLASLAESGKIEKLKVAQAYYRVRFGDYRVGLRLEGDTLVFERALHRKDIYKVFP